LRRFASKRAYNGGHPSEPQQSCLVLGPEEAGERPLHEVEDPDDALALSWLIEVEIEPPRRVFVGVAPEKESHLPGKGREGTIDALLLLALRELLLTQLPPKHVPTALGLPADHHGALRLRLSANSLQEHHRNALKATKSRVLPEVNRTCA
jgi:hypothetical protein